MRNLIKRIFPTRPSLGIALVATIIFQAVASAATIVATHERAVEGGGWVKTSDVTTNSFRTCAYKRNADSCTKSWLPYDPSNYGYDCLNNGPGHHGNGAKSGPANITNCNKEYDEGEDGAPSPSGGINQDHYISQTHSQ